jgi:acid stress-induced BolA-like protein IbaG/YrbA
MMGNSRTIRVSLPTDEQGMVGRQCPSPECGQYFKLKPGTGLPIEDCGCPYCGTRADSSDFMTADQSEYVESVALRQVLEPSLRDFKHAIEALNRPTSRSLIQLKFSVNLPALRLHSYEESEVETDVTCDNCGLEFAVFGVFASCPDCGKLNAFQVFESSLEVCRRRLGLLSLPETVADQELTKAILVDTLGSAIAAFDALGKTLRQARPDIFPARPKNLFQNTTALDQSLVKGTGAGIGARLGTNEFSDLSRLFQVRHIYEHNLGVIDDEFVAKIPAYRHLKGRFYPLSRGDIERLLDLLGQLASSLKNEFGTPERSN